MADGAHEALLRTIGNEFMQVAQHLEEVQSLAGCSGLQRRLRSCLTYLSLLPETPGRTRLQRAIEDLVSGMSAADLWSSIDTRCNIQGDTGGVHIPTDRTTGSVGRPRINIRKEQLEVLIKRGYSGVQIAHKFKVSSSYIYKRLKVEDLQPSSRYSSLSTEDLHEIVCTLKKDFPNAGYRVIRGLLQSQGFTVQRNRVRNAVRAVDPEGTVQRWAYAVSRRSYKVAAPNSLWHIDANLKLARYGMVVHGAIDGSSHMVLYLKCLNNKTAASVLSLFVKAAAVYGVPSRVRSDHGLENIDVAVFMNMVRGQSRSSHITGSSVHNQRIERLWRDVHHQVLKPFKEVFIELQEGCLLDVNNGCHLQALHAVYMVEVNKRLELFRQGWNCHKMSTDLQQRTPQQQWIDGMVEHVGSGLTAVDSVFQDQTLQRTLDNLSQDHVHNLEDDHLEHDSNVQYLSAEQSIALQRAIEGITDLKVCYIRAVQILALRS